jgi:stress-induced morphogen
VRVDQFYGVLDLHEEQNPFHDGEMNRRSFLLDRKRSHLAHAVGSQDSFDLLVMSGSFHGVADI